MSEQKLGLYPVNIALSNNLPGGPTLHLDLLVNAATGALSGSGSLTQALAPPWGKATIAGITGQMEEVGIPKAERLLRVTGRYAIPFGPPPIIGQIEALMTMACVVDLQWDGRGSFSYGPHAEHVARDCIVGKVGSATDAKVGTLDAVPA